MKNDRPPLINVPLTTKYFDLMCHFLCGSVQKATQEDANLASKLEDVLRASGLDITMLDMDHGGQGSGNFLPTFFTIAMSLIISHYDVVSNYTVHDHLSEWLKLKAVSPVI